MVHGYFRCPGHGFFSYYPPVTAETETITASGIPIDYHRGYHEHGTAHDDESVPDTNSLFVLDIIDVAIEF